MQTIADIEIDPDAPYGRKKNGQPYKTKPCVRKAVDKYCGNHRDENAERTRKWTENNREKHDTYMKNYYQQNREKCILRAKENQFKKTLELKYLRELFNQSLQPI